MQKFIAIGRLTKKPELRYTQSQKAVSEFNLAVNRRHQNEDGSRDADFITCVAWNAQAENLAKYQGKGSQIAIEGEYRIDRYQNQDGENRYKHYILVERIQYLDSKNSNAETADNTTNTNQEEFSSYDSVNIDEIELDDDDLPF